LHFRPIFPLRQDVACFFCGFGVAARRGVGMLPALFFAGAVLYISDIEIVIGAESF
jgi:hypothetical protein